MSTDRDSSHGLQRVLQALNPPQYPRAIFLGEKLESIARRKHTDRSFATNASPKAFLGRAHPSTPHRARPRAEPLCRPNLAPGTPSCSATAQRSDPIAATHRLVRGFAGVPTVFMGIPRDSLRRKVNDSCRHSWRQPSNAPGH